MAQAKKVRAGQVWTDSKGRELEVVAPQGPDGKFLVRNVQTGRTLKRGARALKDMVRAVPAAPAAHGVHEAIPAAPPTPRRRPAPRQMSEAQRAFFAKGGAARRKARSAGLANPDQEEVGYPMASFRGGSGGFHPGAGMFSNPYDEDYGHDEEEDYEPLPAPPYHPPYPTAPAPMLPNPHRYPSELAKFVCEQIAQMDAREAEFPASLLLRVNQAVKQWTVMHQQRGIAPMAHRRAANPRYW